MAQLTVTPDRLKLVDFTNPIRSNVNEVLVTGPGSTAIASLDDLSSTTVSVRKGSVYAENLRALIRRNVGSRAQAIPVDGRSVPEGRSSITC